MNICERIHNIKNSLEKAERSFRNNKELRGELDLMLAEAEMKHLREKQKSVFIWNRQSLAFLVAMLVVVAGYGGWWYAASTEEMATFNNAEPKVFEKIIVQQQKIEIPKPEQERFRQETAIVVPIQVTEVKQSRAGNIPQSEIRQLVRSARITLRDSN